MKKITAALGIKNEEWIIDRTLSALDIICDDAEKLVGPDHYTLTRPDMTHRFRDESNGETDNAD